MCSELAGASGKITFSGYLKALEHFEKAVEYGIHPGLSGIQGLLRELGDPQKGLNVIHIAGTNGKGSLSAFLRNIFLEAGYSPGVFNSPALQDYRERILLKGRKISQKSFTEYAGAVEEACSRLTEKGNPHPSQFEMDLAMAFLAFRDRGSDPVILECGMGGREDATNVVEKPLLCAFTSISMDHMKFLGKTLSEIAGNKAGILKEGTEAVTAEQPEEVLRVLEREAQSMRVTLTKAEVTQAKAVRYTLSSLHFRYTGFPAIGLSMGGDYQLDNAVLALECVRLLRKHYRLGDGAVTKGLKNTRWAGRFEILRKKPLLILDGAHNPGGAARLAGSLKRHLSGKRIVLMLGMLKDKDAEGVLRELAAVGDTVVVFKPPRNPRAMDALELGAVAGRFFKRVTVADSLEEALELGELLTDKDGVLVACGSLSFGGRLKELVGK